jgi:hypothetical protein
MCMTKLFYEIKKKSKISDELYEFAVSQPTPLGKEQGVNNIPMWRAPNEILRKDVFLWNLMEKYQAIGYVFYYKPWEHYKWHYDVVRTVGLNLALNDVRHHVFFDTGNIKSFNETMMRDFVELRYKPHTYHVLNTGVYHCGFNFQEYRYFFTAHFPKEVISFDQLIEELIEEDLLFD